MNALEWVLQVFLYLIGIFLLLNCAYIFLFTIAGFLTVRQRSMITDKKHKIALLIPAYREDAVILESAVTARGHSYSGLFDVIVIADGLKEETIGLLRGSGIKVIEVHFENSTKGKALLWAMNSLAETEYDIAMVLDIDNIMSKGVLNEISNAFNCGYKVVQAHRGPKNLNTSLSFLDACSEEISNRIFRQGPVALGLSSALIGSGMAFEFQYFKKLLVGIGDTVGEDKELDFRVAKDQVKIAYLKNVIVLDEKISDSGNFAVQRSRWISAQLDVLKRYTPQLFSELAKGNMEFLNKLYQAWILPRILMFALVTFFFVLSFFVHYGLPMYVWATAFVCLSFSLLAGIPADYYRNPMFQKAVLRLPNATFWMIIALFRSGKRKKTFMPTGHSPVVSPKVNS